MRAVGFWNKPWMLFLGMVERKCRARRDSRRWRRGGGDGECVLVGAVDELMQRFSGSRCSGGVEGEELRDGRWGSWGRAGG